MEAKELRIGNLYNLIEEDVDPNDVYQVGDGYSLYLIWKYDNAKPIPLTKEWLSKCNEFDKTTENENLFDNTDKEGNTIELSLQDNGTVTVWMGGNNACTSGHGYDAIEIDYVHELQNLYFSIKKEELTFK